MQLSVNSVENVNREVDCDNISYIRKAMIGSCMSLAIDGTWSIHQKISHIQDIIGKISTNILGATSVIFNMRTVFFFYQCKCNYFYVENPSFIVHNSHIL